MMTTTPVTDARRQLIAVALRIAPKVTLSPDMTDDAIREAVVAHRLNEPADGRRTASFMRSAFETFASMVVNSTNVHQPAPSLSVGDASRLEYEGTLSAGYRRDAERPVATVEAIMDLRSQHYDAAAREAQRRHFLADSAARKAANGSAYGNYIAGLAGGWRS